MRVYQSTFKAEEAENLLENKFISKEHKTGNVCITYAARHWLDSAIIFLGNLLLNQKK
jgi:hypothetical protein